MKKLKGLLFIIGAVLILGGIGAEQTGDATFGEAILQCLIGLPMCAIGVL